MDIINAALPQHMAVRLCLTVANQEIARAAPRGGAASRQKASVPESRRLSALGGGKAACLSPQLLLQVIKSFDNFLLD
jgi:hypothetical protein